jgi:hypothetical protein
VQDALEVRTWGGGCGAGVPGDVGTEHGVARQGGSGAPPSCAHVSATPQNSKRQARWRRRKLLPTREGPAQSLPPRQTPRRTSAGMLHLATKNGFRFPLLGLPPRRLCVCSFAHGKQPC